MVRAGGGAAVAMVVFLGSEVDGRRRHELKPELGSSMAVGSARARARQGRASGEGEGKSSAGLHLTPRPGARSVGVAA